MLQYDPAQRISAQKALIHPYLEATGKEERKKEELRKQEKAAEEKKRQEAKMAALQKGKDEKK
jgi:hypothetical protein